MVLIVEDDELLREILEHVVRAGGYRTITAATATEALDALQEKADVDAVISDVVLPDLDGPELIRRLRALRPDLPALFMSGYAAADLVKRGMLPEGAPFIGKPLQEHDLLGRLDGLVSGRWDGVR